MFDCCGKPQTTHVEETTNKGDGKQEDASPSARSLLNGARSVHPVLLKVFPKRWGKPPQPSDDGEVVQFAGGYGTGAKELGNWIQEKMQSDQERAPGRNKDASGVSEEERHWQGQQEKVKDWEVKELLTFLECAEEEWGLDDEKKVIVDKVREVQAATINRYLDMVGQEGLDQSGAKEAWKNVVNQFLGKCLDSLNSRPPERDFSFIHIAAQQGNTDVLHQLLKLSANVFLKAKDGRTAREIAEEAGNAKAEEFLEAAETRHAELEKKTEQKASTFAQTGCETLQPRAFKKKGKLFEYHDESHFTSFSNMGQVKGWDATAVTFNKGVTKVTVRFEPRGTTKQSGLADTHKRACIFGLTETDSLEPGLDKGVWAVTETSPEARKAIEPKKKSPTQFDHSLDDITPEDIMIMEKVANNKIVLKRGKKGTEQVEELKVFVNAGNKDWPDMFAKLMLYDPNDCVLIETEPYVSVPIVLRQTIEMQTIEYGLLLKAITHKLLPDWLKDEVAKKEDPTDKKGHMMYVASLIVMSSTRAWTKDEAQSMDSRIRTNYAIPFNHHWVEDLGKVLKKIWNNGGVPSLDNLRAWTHARIPGSCKNKAVLALVLVDVIRPEHRWKAWTVWRARNDEEADGRFPHKKETPQDICYCQLHCVNAHAETHLWFDVIRFWDRDPFHKWPLRYPDPELLNAPTPSNFDLCYHTEWLRDQAAPGGKYGYGCPKQVKGCVPLKLYELGVRGDKVQGAGEEEEEEEEQDDDEASLLFHLARD